MTYAKTKRVSRALDPILSSDLCAMLQTAESFRQNTGSMLVTDIIRQSSLRLLDSVNQYGRSRLNEENQADRSH
ncbi:hypothetical protein J6590_090382 [Homalodisca vitripennis]|nr:hypothetical protein J6590_087957 [Homalodisca vitripennis]KAG8299881.1 hypothetical protein J6590_090382 [Homalodisca vitripennis]